MNIVKDMSFEQWMIQVNKQIRRQTVVCWGGLSAADLPDYPFRTAYADALSPQAAAAAAVRSIV